MDLLVLISKGGDIKVAASDSLFYEIGWLTITVCSV